MCSQTSLHGVKKKRNGTESTRGGMERCKGESGKLESEEEQRYNCRDCSFEGVWEVEQNWN